MTDRIDLSADTYIDGEYLVTKSREVSEAWRGREGAYGLDDDTWSISRATARECYQYVEDEPWVGEMGQPWATGLHCFVDCGSAYPGAIMRRRAALVCDTAEQFRALHEWIGGKG